MAAEKRIERANDYYFSTRHSFDLTDYKKVHPDERTVTELMASFASIEVAAKLREVVLGLREIHQIGYCSALEHGQICFMCEYIDKLTAEADALEGK